MNIDIRQAIVHNVKNNTKEQLEATIVDAIQDGAEKLLPGLGVLFEIIWKQASEQERLEMIEALESGIKREIHT